MNKWIRGRIVVGAIVGVLTLGGGVALAAFTSTGSGSVFGVSGRVQAPTATGKLSGTLKLHPGVRRAIQVTVTNPNDFAVAVITVARSANPVTVDAAHAAGCVTTGVSLNNAAYTVNWMVPASSTRIFQISNAMRMTNASDNGCQGATFSLPIQITARAS